MSRSSRSWSLAFPSRRVLVAVACAGLLGACASSPPTGSPKPSIDASLAPDVAVPDVAPVSGQVMISAATRTPRASSGLGTSYWQWTPTWGNLIAGTETQVLELGPAVLRVGGHNNDTNTPDPFSNAEIDRAVAYARAVAAEPILQVPLLADATGQPSTPAAAAAMVSYANVDRGYGIKYFSIGNEPDLYPNATSAAEGIPGYTPAAFCASATAYAAAMKAVDPSIKLLGPELSWKYQSGDNDWLTPILQTCGALFDVVTVHRYPIDPTQTTLANAAADAPKLADAVAHLREIMRDTGMGDKPLAITESNITWDGAPAKSILPASPGSVPAGLWAADTFGVSLQVGLWADIYWSTREGWTLGLFDSTSGKARPSYWSFYLYAKHFGPTLLPVSSSPSGVRAYASRNQTDNGTQVIVVNWNDTSVNLAFEVQGLTARPTANFLLPPLSVSAVEIPDVGTPSALVYGDAQYRASAPPAALGPS